MPAATKAKIAAFGLVILAWWSLSQIYPPLVVPGIPAVTRKILEIISHTEWRQTILVTFVRLVTALFIGTLSGFAVGLICCSSRAIRNLAAPLIGILQVIPPVSLLILATIWLGYNGKPAIFIVVLAVFPPMVISVQNGILSIDRKLLEMGRTFKLSRWSIFINIIIPSIAPSLTSGWKISLGLACKTMVMAEVLTTPTGIGGALALARMDLEPETVIAWTVITVLIFYLISNLSKAFSVEKKKRLHAGDQTPPAKQIENRLNSVGEMKNA